MSVERKIKELLERVNVKDSLEEADTTIPMGSSGVSKDSTLKAANSGDATNPKQGDSKDMSFETREEDGNQGAKVSGGIKKNTIQAKGPGQAPNFGAVGTKPPGQSDDPTSVINMKAATGNRPVTHLPVSEEEESEEEVISTEDDTEEVISEEGTEVESTEEISEKIEQDIDLASIFGDDLSEEFRTKATAIFEAAVIAKVNNEMDKITEALAQKFAEETEIYKESIVEKVDAYLNYVVENWMEENKIAIENGLRTEIAEDFISGLKVLFKEHYIEVPEEKYDVMGELQNKVEELEGDLNEQISNNVYLNSEVTELKKKIIVKEMAKDLADTEAKKLEKLLENVDFDNDELYKEKVQTIKESYFPTEKTKTAQKTLIEEATEEDPFAGANDTISTYAKALSRSIKRT